METNDLKEQIEKLPDEPQINTHCPVCFQEQDLSHMNPDDCEKLRRMSEVSVIALRLFEFLSAAVECKKPLLTQLSQVDYQTKEEVVKLDLWVGVGETMVARLFAKNQEIAALEQRVAQYEEWLRMIEIGIGDLPYFAKQALDGDELKSPLSNALKNGGGECT